MTWLDLASNPESIGIFYIQPPSLDAVAAVSLFLQERRLYLTIEIVGIPDKRPKGWPVNANAMQVTFGFLDLQEVTLQGWRWPAVGRLLLEPAANGGVRFQFDTTAMRLEGISGILHLQIAQPGYVKASQGNPD